MIVRSLDICAKSSLHEIAQRIATVGSAILALALALIASGCVTHIPVDEYTLARAAYQAAKEYEAPRHASALWFNAETAYRKAEKAFRDRRYQEARVLFVEAKNYAEQAENAARLSRHQSGEVLP